MKRSKVFLGVTTGILAIVGVAAAKSSKFTNKLKGWYSTGDNAGCINHCAVSYFTVNSGQGRIATCGTHTLYSRFSSVCNSNPLLTQQAD